MDREVDQVKIKQLLTATIASLCNNSLSYSGELTIQGLLGITIDRKDILLVNINETLGHGGSPNAHQQCQTVARTHAEHSQTGSLQPLATGIEQNYTSENSIVAVRQKEAVNAGGKSTPASKKRGQHNRTPAVNYAQTYSPSLQNVKIEPGLEQVKVEPTAEYAGGYFAGDEDNSYDNYDMYYDQAGGMYADPGGGGSFSNSGQFADDAMQVMEYSKPRAHKVQKVRTQVKKPGIATSVRSASRPVTQSQSSIKDVNSTLVQRALDLVHEGQLTAGVAIKLFGIPRSTFYKKLSMCNQQPQPTSTPDAQAQQYFQGGSDFQTDFGTSDFGSGGIADSFVGATGSADGSMSVGQWSNYGDYYAT